MASHLTRRVIRIKNLPDALAQVLVKDLNNFLQVEVHITKQNAVCAYFPRKIQHLVQQKMLSALNTYATGGRQYTVEDLEVKSTVVVISNVPYINTDEKMDTMLSVYGKLLLKYQQAKWRKKPLLNYTKRFGWVVFEDIHSAELCEKQFAKQMIDNCYLDATIVPEYVTTEKELLESTTLKMEGFPSSMCSEERISELLRSISPDIIDSLKYLKTKAVQYAEGSWRYMALLEWITPNYAMKIFQRLNGFRYFKNGEFIAHLTVSFSSPGCKTFTEHCAFLDFLNRRSDSPPIPLQQGSAASDSNSIMEQPPSYEESENMHKAQLSTPGYSTRPHPNMPSQGLLPTPPPLLPTPPTRPIGTPYPNNPPRHYMNQHMRDVHHNRNFHQQQQQQQPTPPRVIPPPPPHFMGLPHLSLPPPPPPMPPGFIIPQAIPVPVPILIPTNNHLNQLPQHQPFIHTLNVQNISIHPNSATPPIQRTEMTYSITRNSVGDDSFARLQSNDTSSLGLLEMQSSINNDNSHKQLAVNKPRANSNAITSTPAHPPGMGGQHRNMPPGYTRVPPVRDREQTLQEIADFFEKIKQNNRAEELGTNEGSLSRIGEEIQQIIGEMNQTESLSRIEEIPDENNSVNESERNTDYRSPSVCTDLQDVLNKDNKEFNDEESVISDVNSYVSDAYNNYNRTYDVNSYVSDACDNDNRTYDVIKQVENDEYEEKEEPSISREVESINDFEKDEVEEKYEATVEMLDTEHDLRKAPSKFFEQKEEEIPKMELNLNPQNKRAWIVDQKQGESTNSGWKQKKSSKRWSVTKKAKTNLAAERVNSELALKKDTDEEKKRIYIEPLVEETQNVKEDDNDETTQKIMKNEMIKEGPTVKSNEKVTEFVSIEDIEKDEEKVKEKQISVENQQLADTPFKETLDIVENYPIEDIGLTRKDIKDVDTKDQPVNNELTAEEVYQEELRQLLRHDPISADEHNSFDNHLLTPGLTPEEEFEDELRELLNFDPISSDEQNESDFESIPETKEEMEESFSIDDHIQAVYKSTKSIFNEQKEEEDKRKGNNDKNVSKSEFDEDTHNKNKSLYHPMNNIIGSLLQMTLIDCENDCEISPRKSLKISKEIPKTPESRLLKFIKKGVSEQKSKPFPREAFASLF